MSKTIPKYVAVEHHIKDGIRNNKYLDRLPGERTLAKELGVSYMTARKAIDNLVDQGVLYKVPTKGAFVNKERDARSRSRTIGYFLDSSIQSGISSPYYSLIFQAIEKEASRNDYSLVYFSDNNQAKLRKTLSKLDGVIATCLPRIEETIQLIKHDVPVVVIDNSAADKSIPSIIIDNFRAVVDSVDYVCSLGHSRIGFMTGLEDSDVGKNRYAGYLHGLEKNGLELEDDFIFRGNYSFSSGVDGAGYFMSLPAPPTAIICANDSMALGAMNKLDKLGVTVPNDISIVGFDDIKVASQITPGLTTVAAPVEEIAKNAFSVLMCLVKGEAPRYGHVALTAELIVRSSCAPLKSSAVA